jgi:hypothetical protein
MRKSIGFVLAMLVAASVFATAPQLKRGKIGSDSINAALTEMYDLIMINATSSVAYAELKAQADSNTVATAVNSSNITVNANAIVAANSNIVANANAIALRYVVIVDPNAVTDTTIYTPAGIGQQLSGKLAAGTNAVWSAFDATTNGWGLIWQSE